MSAKRTAIEAVSFGEGLELGGELAPTEPPEGLELATFAGGNFWGLQLMFDRLPGVVSTNVGYTQGRIPHPCYSIVLTDTTGHALAVQVIFDSEVVSYDQLMDALFLHVDPTTKNAQRGDKGTAFRSGIYYHTNEQMLEAKEKLKSMQADIDVERYRETTDTVVAVEIKPAGDFYLAESHYQHFFENGGRSGNKQSAEKGCEDPIQWSG